MMTRTTRLNVKKAYSIPLSSAVLLATTVLTITLATPGSANASGHANLLRNPRFEISNPSGTYFQNCVNTGGTPSCAGQQTGAADWLEHNFQNGGGEVWTENDLTRSTAPRGGKSMLHVSGTAAGIGQTGDFGTSPTFSAWVDPLFGAVQLCLGPTGSGLVCVTSNWNGTWKELGPVTYPGSDPAPTEILIDGVCPNGGMCSQVKGYTEGPYTDFYVDNASVTNG